jgi:putative transposase
LAGINRQSYYRAISGLQMQKTTAAQVVALVGDIRVRMPRLGVKKLYHILEPQLVPLKVGRDKLFDILRSNCLLIKAKKQYHVTTDSHHRFKKHKNLVEGLTIKRPEQVLVSDITYIGTRKCPMYLSLVTDAYSKKIMGHNVSESLGAAGATTALKMAVKNRSYPNGDLLHHSDRGVQYCCDVYQKTLAKAGIKCSMTEKYDPYQNAVAERVNGILKQEFIGGFENSNFKLMKALVNNSIEIYNNERPHFSSKMLTPKAMHQQSEVEMRTYKNKKLSTIL